MRSNGRIAALIVAAAVVVVAIVVLLVAQPWAGGDASEEAQQPAEGPAASTPPVLDPTTHVLTDAGEGAPVLVEFLDFECPTCGAVFPTMEALRAEYGDDVTFAVRYLPIPSHANGLTSALAAEAAAEQGAFEEMYVLLFSRQDEWAGTTSSQADVFRGYAEELGLDLDAYDTAIADPATLERVQLDADAAVALGVQSTPTIFIDGEPLELQTIDDIEAGIVAALEE